MDPDRAARGSTRRAPAEATMIALLLALSLAARPHPAPPPSVPVAGTVVEVMDGDTIHVRLPDASASGRRPRPVKVRLYGVDAPEKDQPHGREATRALAALVQGREVLLERVATDRFGRMVARVQVDGRDVAAALLEGGHAWAFRRYLGRRPGDDRLCALEYEARARGAGLWALDPRDRDAPWAHRHEGRGREKVAAERSAADCVRAFERQ